MCSSQKKELKQDLNNTFTQLYLIDKVILM